ncbi:uncharacterized protein DMENIID0001_003440 [Sergentomyia squamirostris]
MKKFRYSSGFYRERNKQILQRHNQVLDEVQSENNFEGEMGFQNTRHDLPLPNVSSEHLSDENMSENSSEETFVDDIDEEYFEDDLRQWSNNYNITQDALRSLLDILRKLPGMQQLPKDPRTLRATPRKTTMVEICNSENVAVGRCWYRNVSNAIISCLTEAAGFHQISLQLFADGLDISNSSSSEVWPIMFRIIEIPELPPQVIAIHYGEGKPKNVKAFLGPVVTELKDVIANGVCVNGRNVKVQIHSVLGDSPARSLLKGTVYFNHRCGCGKCTVEGDFFKQPRHMSYANLNAPLRTDESFRGRIDEDHHREDSPMEELPIDMIKDFPVSDSLHLLHQGVMKRMLTGWYRGDFNFKTKWSTNDASSVSNFLIESNKYRPSDLHRKIRPLCDLRNWKATEFRSFLLYLGCVILKDFVKTDVYNNFMLLFCAISIFETRHYEKYYEIAGKMLEEFVKGFMDIYGQDSINSNLHNLIHVMDDVKHLGPLPEISTYPFENRLSYIKKMVHTGNLPLAQLSRRLIERTYTKRSKGKETYPRAENEYNVKCKLFMLSYKNETVFIPLLHTLS